MILRCFIALEAPTEVRKCLVDKIRLWRNHRGVNWVAEQNLHLTLLFLGDVDSSKIEELRQILQEVTDRTKALSLSLKGLELFPAKLPRLIWSSLDNADQSIYTLHKDLLSMVRQAGFEPDVKPLKLHITLGRLKSQLPEPVEREIMQSSVDKDSYLYDTITLYRSILKPDGPTYQILQQYKLT